MKKLLQKTYKNNLSIFLIFLFLSFIVYHNTLDNEFAVIDDYTAIVTNPNIQELGANLKSLQIYKILISLFYYFFGMNPVPYHVFAVFNHSIVSLLVFFLAKKIFNKNLAYFASVLFVLHPVNSEALNWISANAYILLSIFLYSSILFYINYREKKKNIYLYILIAIHIFAFGSIRHPWTLLIPLTLVFTEIFFVKEKLNKDLLKRFLWVLIPIVLTFLITVFSSDLANRLQPRLNNEGRILTAQQSLTPVLEGYPYTVYSLTRLYLFPNFLTIYYDGTPLNIFKYVLMYVIFFVYLGSIFYFYKKDKKISVVLMLLLLLISPTFSPIKITWYISERYLYFGTGFFTMLLVYILSKIENKFDFKHFTIVVVLILSVLYSYRTYLRNNEWQTPETLAKATISTSPQSIRVYNDLAGYYLLENEVENAKKYYVQALNKGPSGTAIRNLGYIYLSTDLDKNITTSDKGLDELLNLSKSNFNSGNLRYSMFYLNEAYSKDPNNTELLNLIAQSFIEFENFSKAEKYLNNSLELDSSNPDTYYILGYLQFKKGKPEFAMSYLKKTLELDPSHEAAQANFEALK